MGAKKDQRDVRLTKKLAKVLIVNTLGQTLTELKEALGDKKFKRRIKQASKLLSTGLPKAVKDKSISKKKMAKDKGLAAQAKFQKNGLPAKSPVLNQEF